MVSSGADPTSSRNAPAGAGSRTSWSVPSSVRARDQANVVTRGDADGLVADQGRGPDAVQLAARGGDDHVVPAVATGQRTQVAAHGAVARVVLGQVGVERDDPVGAGLAHGQRAGRRVDGEPEVPPVEDAGERRPRAVAGRVGGRGGLLLLAEPETLARLVRGLPRDRAELVAQPPGHLHPASLGVR